MRKMIVFMSTGYAGMDACSALLVKDSATADEIQEQAWQLAVEHAESYGIYPYPESYPEYSEDDYEGLDDSYSDNIEGYAVDYVPHLHDRKRSGGGSFETDFAKMTR